MTLHFWSFPQPFCVLCAGRGAVGKEQNVTRALWCPEAMKLWTHGPVLPSQGPAPLPAPQKWGCPRAPCCQHRGLWWLLALGKPPGREDEREARGHLHHRIPVGSRDPVPGSLPGQGINSAGWAGRGTGLCGRRQQEQGANCPSPVPPHPLGPAQLCTHACSPKGKCKSQGLFVTLIKPTFKRV